MTPPPSAPRRSLSILALAALVLAALAVAAQPALAQGRIAVGPRVGTSGLGLDLVGRVSDHAHVRLAAGTVGFDETISTDDIDYDAEATIETAFLLLDWYPGAGAFRLSAGAGWNGTEVEVSAPLEPFLRREIPRIPPDVPFEFGFLTGTGQGEEIVPVVLLGWGNPFRGGRVNLSFEIGAFYQGEPDVELALDTEVPIDSVPGLRDEVNAALEEEELELERELEDYTIVPVVSFSLTFRF
jgi:hypothetical protein